MSDVVIRAESLGKKYTIGHATQRERYTALRDVVARGVHTGLRKAGDFIRGRPIVEGDELEEVWALHDASFEVRRGEVIGIIGRNGAGKSTLLKILSRITEPSEGRAMVRGRVASLLEVGTGFHPELTGRENIFLNGAILGMTRAEIRMKFDEIVAFAEVERFLDTPVKRYSSGMYVRLAFSVAAHIDPEILLIDEVLAVGDLGFQEKCLGKIKDVSRAERTVLVVSHNIGVIRQLASKTLVLSKGELSFWGQTKEAIAGYVAASAVAASPDGEETLEHQVRTFEGLTRALDFAAVRVLNEARLVMHREAVRLAVTVTAREAVTTFRIGITVISIDGTPVGSTFSPYAEAPASGGRGTYELTFANHGLVPGTYLFNMALFVGDILESYSLLDLVYGVGKLEVSPQKNDSNLVVPWSPAWGAIEFTPPRLIRTA